MSLRTFDLRDVASIHWLKLEEEALILRKETHDALAQSATSRSSEQGSYSGAPD